MCDVIGAERPSYLQGESLLPLVDGEAEAVREAIFAEKTYHVAYEPERCAPAATSLSAASTTSTRPPVLANIDDGPSKDLVLSDGLAERPIPEERLFDLLYDPNAANNLAGDPAYRDVLEEMRGRLEAWMEQTDDPVLRGPVPAPADARRRGDQHQGPALPQRPARDRDLEQTRKTRRLDGDGGSGRVARIVYSTRRQSTQ